MNRCVVLAGLLFAAGPVRVASQQLSTPWMPLEAPPVVQNTGRRSPPKWLPPLASVLLPGSGQLLQGHARGAVYFAVEGFLLLRFLAFYREGLREGDQYRQLAFTVARAPFDPVVRDTVFEYYEQMGKFIESGPYDADPGPGFAPPVDERTYNGNIWRLASETYFGDPTNPPPEASIEYQRALAFYQRRAIGPNFLWSWRNAGLEQDLFRRSIEQSDEGFRRATQQLGLLLANHLISAIDAFVTGRLAEGRGPVEVRSSVGNGPAGMGTTWSTAVRIAF